MVIEVTAGNKGKTTAAILAAGSFGGFVIFAGCTGRINAGLTAQIVIMVFGALLLSVALLGMLGWKIMTRPVQLVIEQHGMRWVDPKGGPWAVAWEELESVAVSRTVSRAPAVVHRAVMVRLDLFPADAGFRDRHPEMEQMWEFHRVRNGYRVPFGDAGELLPRLDNGLRIFAGSRYRGVVDEGFTVGLF